MKLFSSAIASHRYLSANAIGAIASHRYLSTKTFWKGTKWTQSKSKSNSNSNSFKNRNNGKRNDPTTYRARIKWTDEQLRVLDAVSRGQSVFITGSAGTGKTILLKHIIKLLKKMYRPSQVFVTAYTGVAAWALKGQTLHSFAGIRPGMGDAQTLSDKVLSDERAWRRWNKAMALVIDESSMIDPELFDKMEYIAKKVRDEKHASNNRAWGGIQMIVSGDFFQLPPVFDWQRRKQKLKEFAFEADCWNSSFDMQVELTKVFRQQDAQLVNLLQRIRRGESDPKDLELLQQCCSETVPDSSVVQLYPLNKDVSRVNKEKLESLCGEIVVYHAIDSGTNHFKERLKLGIAPDVLELCLGARVMLSKNISPWKKLMNGSTGTVTDYYKPNGHDDEDVMKMCEKGLLPVVKFDSGPEMVIDPDIWELMEGEKVVAVRKQIPLILAWALSIHKCQGMTLDHLQTDLSRAFGYGMVYVALSRVRSLDGLHLFGFNPSKIKAHPKVVQFYQSFASKQDKQAEDDGTHQAKSNNNSLVDTSDIIICRGTKDRNYHFEFQYKYQKGN